MDTISPDADVVVGTHPIHGICATNPSQQPVTTYYLDRLGFEPVPGHPFLHRLVAPENAATDRARAAITAMRRAGLTVQADFRFEPFLPLYPGTRPDVVIAEIPQIGIAAATDPPLGRPDPDAQTLAGLGWHPHPDHNVHVLPDTDRATALAIVTRTAVALQTQGRQVGIDPALTAEARTARPASTAPVPRAPAASLRANALATSPARSALPTTLALPAPLPQPAPSAQTPRTQTNAAER
jgi:hypothetical protein